MATAVTFSTRTENPMGSQDLQAYIDAKDLCAKVQHIGNQVLLVNTRTQFMHHLEEGAWVASYLISTSKNGVGQKEGSEQTPLGLHQIKEKIGNGAEPYAIFVSREPTGEIALPNDRTRHIVGRILRLEGLQEGFNKGGSVDSYQRHIYIHGTNRIQELGDPSSIGCISMAPDDVIQLFNEVPVETAVYIYGSPNQGIFGRPPV